MKTQSSPVTSILEHLEVVTQTGNGQWQALCPAHDDHKPSLSISEDSNGCALIKCHAGCETEEILSALDLSMKDLFPRESNQMTLGFDDYIEHETSTATLSSLGKLVAEYDYRDGNGKLLYQVVRYDPKTFRQRQPNNTDGWIWNTKGVQRVLYRLPELIKADSEAWIFIVEGEKDVDALVDLDLTATTNAGGAGKWNQISDVNVLAERRIAIIPDLDLPGQQHATDIAERLYETAKEIRIVDLKKDIEFLGNDVSDWLDSKDHKNPALSLLEMVEASPPWRQEEWKEPTPLSKRAQTVSFPVEALPDWVADMVAGVAQATQTPVEFVGGVALGVLSMTITGRVLVQGAPGWDEQANLYIAVVMDSGTRKSAVFSAMVAPLEIWEELEQSSWENEIAHIESERRIHKEKLRNHAKRQDGGDEGTIEEARRLSSKLAQKPIPVQPRLLTADVTPEGVARLLDEQNGRMGIFSSEGDEIFSIMSGRYSKNGKSNFDVFLKAYSGDTIRVDRANRNRQAIIIRNPALCIVLCLQPSVLKSIWQKREFNDRGLLARFQWILPMNLLGTRKIDVSPVSDKVSNKYKENILGILGLTMNDQENGLTVLELSEEAIEELNNFRRELEPKLGLGGEYENEAAWASKLPGSIVRIAGLLHIAKHVTKSPSWKEPISLETMKGAIALGRFFCKQFETVRNLYGKTPGIIIAERILDQIQRKNIVEFSERDMYRLLGTNSAEIAMPLLLLEKNNYVRRVKSFSLDKTKGSGRNPSPRLVVNPVFHHGSVNYVMGDRQGA